VLPLPFPEEAEDEELRCAVMGVFAPLTGLIGTALAAEAIKWLAGLGAALSGRLVLFDALTMQWRSLNVARDPHVRSVGRRRRRRSSPRRFVSSTRKRGASSSVPGSGRAKRARA